MVTMKPRSKHLHPEHLGLLQRKAGQAGTLTSPAEARTGTAGHRLRLVELGGARSSAYATMRRCAEIL